jgi:hypothetical protein
MGSVLPEGRFLKSREAGISAREPDEKAAVFIAGRTTFGSSWPGMWRGSGSHRHVVGQMRRNPWNSRADVWKKTVEGLYMTGRAERIGHSFRTLTSAVLNDNGKYERSSISH